jgi:hypothetical protein
MHARATLACLLLCSLALAGCLAPGEAPPVGPVRPEQGASVPVTPTAPGTGAVTGLVVTEDLFPAAGAEVTLASHGAAIATVRTDETGRYAFANVPPGKYELQFDAPCCLSKAREVVVTAGQETHVNLILSLAPSVKPYTEGDQWEGFLGCAFVLFVVGQCPDPNQDNVRAFALKPGAITILAALVWEPSTPDTDQTLRLWLEHGEETLADRTGDSPLILRFDGEPDVLSELENGTLPTSLSFRVWPGGEVNVVYQQPFTLYYRIHYVEAAAANDTALPR